MKQSDLEPALKDREEFIRLIKDNTELLEIAKAYPNYAEELITRVLEDPDEIKRLIKDDDELNDVVKQICTPQLSHFFH
ncbi:hypothetical protein DM455_15710 [Legionella pneumophila]|uniref:hypothetical protein n=1 Tax=Legionella pneumophila TaxID=446 RepID=UPI000D7C2B62|nr:hypothetical protein [Legionella pneumophila]PYB42461.1 hypothetical protein DM454_15170 [Legionella pneumophila]PYB47330.1 hypothetical protein DM456_15315 [Legionella pneumophila]PYB59209.1 hypothetical protein DM455_15710 [Legionella pneumophila]TID57045.1 hypothetical protein DIZ38_15500 [Legionella pneumophila]TID57552.1 hypothetical protein DIZ40_14425 [Legionella pneumophila]